MRFPTLPAGDRIRQSVQTAFGGLNRTAGASDGDLCDMFNLWSGDWPRLSVRPGRVRLGTLAGPNGLFRTDRRFTVDGGVLYVDGVSAGTLTEGRKVFAALGDRLLIWPDKKAWSPGDGLVSLESSVTASCTFTDGTYAGEPAEGNTLRAADGSFDWGAYFNVGDAVTVSGSSHGENDQTIIIREIHGEELRFYENSFTNDSTAADITVARTVPDLDWLCVNENRVWGCKGDTIYASKLGDPRNWNVFDGLSTDSWTWDTGTAGDFTGCVSFLGYPCFFKERQIFKVYGDRPANFEPMGAPDLGVMAGCGRSLAVANETLFYLSRVGPMAYAGGVPRPIGTELGERLREGVGGSDGLRYYLSAKGGSGASRLYVYDALRQLWHIQDETEALEFAPGAAGSVECLTAAGTLWTTDASAAGTAEGAVSWYAELGDYTRQSPKRKGLSKLLLRLEPGTGSSVTVLIRYDGRGDWETAATITGAGKGSRYLPVIPRRCDHFRLRLAGTGPCLLHSLTVESYEGSPN